MSINFEKFITVEKNANESTKNLPITERINKIFDMIEDSIYEVLSLEFDFGEDLDELDSICYRNGTAGAYTPVIDAKFAAAFNGVDCKYNIVCFNTCDDECKNVAISVAFIDENGKLQMVNKIYEGEY